MFGWMNVDRGLKWYSRLLTMAMKNMDEEEEDAGWFIPLHDCCCLRTLIVICPFHFLIFVVCSLQNLCALR